MPSPAPCGKEWFNVAPSAPWRVDEAQTPFKVQGSALLEVPGLADPKRALVDPAHTWHIGFLCCKGSMYCMSSLGLKKIKPILLQEFTSS